MNQALIVAGELPIISVSTDMLKHRDKIVKSAEKIKTVEDKADETLATVEKVALQEFIKLVENSRKSVKQIALDFGRKVDSMAEDAVESAKNQLGRIKDLLGAYQVKLDIERQKIEREAERKRQEAEKALRDAESARIAAEKKQTAMTEAKAERMEEKAIEKRVEVMQLEQQAAATKVKGGSMVLDYDVIDILALYNDEPTLVSVEPKRREILEKLKFLEETGRPVVLSGLKVKRVPRIR